MLRIEYEELRDALDVKDVRCLCRLSSLFVLSCVRILLWPYADPSRTGDLDAPDVLGLPSTLPSNGPGAIVSIRFDTFSPPFVRGLSGANRGLGSAYLRFIGSSRSRFGGFTLWGVALLLGKGGKAQSIFEGRSGEGGALGRIIGVVTLRPILKGDFGGAGADNGVGLLESLQLLIGDDGSTGRKGSSTQISTQL